MTDAAKLRGDSLVGVGYALAAFAWWGLNPFYFKAVDTLPVLEVVGHRVLWSVLLLAIFITAGRRWPAIAAIFRKPRMILLLAASGIILLSNWSLYIWSVVSDQLLQASLGYYINPLVSMLLGFVVLRERMRRGQWFAIGLATLGVLNLAIAYGVFPWLALTLAVTFGVYGLLRKIGPAESLDGLFVETFLVLPIAAAPIVYYGVTGGDAFLDGTLGTKALLMLAGPVTAIPLLWFIAAAKRLRLATLGFCQYLNPTFQLVLGAFVFEEPFTSAHLVTFALIWTAIAIYSVDTLRGHRRAIAAV
jgi:chloramphenicol-sensitive protein RarD